MSAYRIHANAIGRHTSEHYLVVAAPGPLTEGWEPCAMGLVSAPLEFATRLEAAEWAEDQGFDMHPRAYAYASDFRPWGHFGAVPEGYTALERGTQDSAPLRHDLPCGCEPWGVIAYPDRLEDPDAWGLRPLGVTVI